MGNITFTSTGGGGLQEATPSAGIRNSLLVSPRPIFGQSYSTNVLNNGYALIYGALALATGSGSISVSNYQIHPPVILGGGIVISPGYESFDCTISYPDSLFDSAEYNAEGQEGGKIYIAWTQDLGGGYYRFTNQWVSEGPRVHPSGYHSGVFDLAGPLFGKEVLAYTSVYNTPLKRFESIPNRDDIYDDDARTVTWRGGNASMSNPQNQLRPLFTEPSRNYAGIDTGYQLTQYNHSLVESLPVHFEWDFGGGQPIETVAVESTRRGGWVAPNTAPSNLSGEFRPGYRMAADLTKPYAQLHAPRVRARDALGRVGAWKRVKVFPCADASASQNPNWDASKSFGRSGALVAYNWHFNAGWTPEKSGIQVVDDMDERIDSSTINFNDYKISQLWVIDENGLAEKCNIRHIHSDRRSATSGDRTNSLVIAAGHRSSQELPWIQTFINNQSELQIHRCQDEAGGIKRQLLQTLPGRCAPTLFRVGSRWWLLSANLTDTGPGQFAVCYSDDYFKTLSDMVEIWPGNFYDMHICPIKGGGFGCVALTRPAGSSTVSEVWFRRSHDGINWPTSGSAPFIPLKVGNTTPNNRTITLLQRLDIGANTLEISNGYDRLWRSQNGGKNWVQVSFTSA